MKITIITILIVIFFLNYDASPQVILALELWVMSSLVFLAIMALVLSCEIKAHREKAFKAVRPTDDLPLYTKEHLIDCIDLKIL